MRMNNANDIDAYIAAFPQSTQKLLKQFRATVRKAAPKAEEKISYGMPAFTLYGNLVYFAGYKNHIGFYPGPGAIKNFQKELSVYKGAKGSVQFPLDKPLPLELISKIVKFRVQADEEKAELKKLVKSLRTCPKGHQYHKSSDCPTCPVCEQERKPKDGFLSTLSAPARRALENKKITRLKQLANYSEAEILELHGMGPGSLPKLRAALKTAGLHFKK